MDTTSLSLLQRLAADPRDGDAWQRLDELYRPLIRHWLARDSGLGDEVDDVIQEVMSYLVQELRGFRRQRTGSFRRWLREITVRRLREFFGRRAARLRGAGGPQAEAVLAELSDPASALSRRWDAEHDRHVLRRLLELVGPQFEAKSLAAFQRVVFDEQPARAVAAELGLTVNAVLIAKARVLGRLRQEAREFLD